MNAHVNRTGMNFRIGGATGIDYGIIVLAVRVGVGTLMNASGIAYRIVAVTAEHHCLRILVQDRVQHLHAP